MNPIAQSLVEHCEHLMAANDGDTSWELINGYFGKVWNKMEPNSPEREAMATVYKKMMSKWH